MGALVIAFAVLVPMMPGMSHAGMMDARAIPPGWDYSPSTWAQRLPIILLGAAGFFIARELAACQMGDRTRWRTMPWMVTFFGSSSCRSGRACHARHDSVRGR
ncbi:MAG: hypothetical protein ACT4P4_08565 [Betaproteobacteria bacterium]